jgi:putative hemolysin
MEDSEEKYDKLINIREVFRKKNPTLLKLIPGFIIQYLRKIIHENELNTFLSQVQHNKGLEQVENAIKEFGVIIKTTGLENIPQNNRCLIASNHPLGGLDGVALMKAVSQIRKDIKFPVNDILLNLPNSEDLFIPINKHGSNASNIELINNTFASNEALLFFPAGFVSRKQKGIIKDLEWKKTFIAKAKKYERDIVPTHIDGRNSNFFYNLAKLRKFLKLKANIEMLYLVNEMYKQNNKTISITFGEPISYQTFDKRFTYAQWAEKVKEHVYNLATNPKSEFNY